MSRNTDSPSRLARRSFIPALAAAIAASGTLVGCQSAVMPEETDRGSARNMDVYVARAVMDGSFGSKMVTPPTIYGGVHEQVRVDSPGPDSAPATTQSGTASPVETPPTREIGVRAASLGATENVINLPLREAIARAVKNNLAIKVEAYNPAIRESQVIQQEAAFDPIAFGASQYSLTDEPLNQLGFFTNGQGVQNQIGIKSLLPTGAKVQAQTNANYQQTTVPAGSSSGLLFNDRWTTNIGLSITQPLLRGFGTDVNEFQIYLAQRDRRISLETFKRQVITQVANVEDAYHNLFLARRIVEIDIDLVDQSKEAQRKVYARGTMDADETAKAQADAAVMEHVADLHNAQTVFRTQSDKLKGFLNDPEFNIRDNMLINPTDEPISEPMQYNAAELIDTALRQRTEIQEDRLRLEQADINVKVAKNGLLPKLDLTLSAQSNGLDDSLDSAFGSTVSPGHWIDYGAGISIEFPLGNRLAESTLRQHQLERKQGLETIARDAQAVVLDVKTQLHSVLESYSEIEYRARAADADERTLRALIAKEEISKLTPEFLQLKLDDQTRLAQAKQALAQAQVNYNLAIMNLEKAKGTLLEFDRISLDHPPLAREAPPNVVDLPERTYNK